MLYFTENAIELASEELASSGTGMPQLDFSTFPSQIFWLAIAFGILYLALSRIFIPRIGGVLEERCDRIADDLDMAVSMKADADAAVIAYESSLKKAAERAHSIAADNKNKISAEIAEELEAQDASLAETLAIAETKINQARQKALTSVSSVAKTAVNDMVTKLTGYKLEAAKITKIVAAATGK
ncbi:MAG: F0F1 ATP synthase subunit B' [Robiginitomaculum sp.]|nr:F0F1 ATP synthase subunit B' [Robiginitomaculum sp.]